MRQQIIDAITRLPPPTGSARRFFVRLLSKLPSPEGCGCGSLKRQLLQWLGVDLLPYRFTLRFLLPATFWTWCGYHRLTFLLHHAALAVEAEPAFTELFETAWHHYEGYVASAPAPDCPRCREWAA